MGGLSKKAHLIKSRKASTGASHLLLDGGNLLFKKTAPAASPSQPVIQANGIIEAYQVMGYDAVAVGPRDLNSGLDLLIRSRDNDFPWISANLTDSDGNTPFPSHFMVNKGGLRIAIIGLTGTLNSDSKELSVNPWQSVLPGLIEDISSRCDLIILLSSLKVEDNKIIANRFDQINIIFGSDPARGNNRPQLINSSLLTQTSSRGKYQGLLEIFPGQSQQWVQPATTELSKLQNRLGALNWQLKRARKRQTNSNGKNSEAIKRIEQNRTEVMNSLASLEKQLKEEAAQGVSGTRFKNTFIGLKRTLADDRQVETIVYETKKEVAEFNHSQKEKRQNKSGAVNSANGLQPSPLVGFSACGECHENQSKFWQATSHARAYETLKEKKQALNLDCLPCHVTMTPAQVNNGQNLEQLLHLPPELQTIGCESCHYGPSRDHTKDPERFKMVRRSGKAVCVRCHQGERDDDFSYEEKLELISCPAG
ncbi:MAG: UshA-like (seleno)protein [Thermodesulfobacteriota bacterium]